MKVLKANAQWKSAILHAIEYSGQKVVKDKNNYWCWFDRNGVMHEDDDVFATAFILHDGYTLYDPNVEKPIEDKPASPDPLDHDTSLPMSSEYERWFNDVLYFGETEKDRSTALKIERRRMAEVRRMIGEALVLAKVVDVCSDPSKDTCFRIKPHRS